MSVLSHNWLICNYGNWREGSERKKERGKEKKRNLFVGFRFAFKWVVRGFGFRSLCEDLCFKPKSSYKFFVFLFFAGFRFQPDLLT